MVNKMSECVACGESSKTQIWCEICTLLVPKITGYSLDWIPDKKKADELRESIGNPSSDIRKVWKSFNLLDLENRDWALDSRVEKLQTRVFDWNRERKDTETIFSKEDERIFRDIIREYKIEEINDMKRLQRGWVLPDGSHLSWISGNFFLDGEVIRLPYRDLREVLETNQNNTFSWKILLYSISLATENKYLDNKPNAWHWARGFTKIGDKNLIKHPINNLDLIDNKRVFNFIQHSLLKNGDRDYWLENWSEILSDRTRMFIKGYKAPRSLLVDKGRLMIRVRRNDTWRKIRVPRDLNIWSTLVNWSLSTPGHENRMKLECLQYYLFCDIERNIISNPDINGIKFLRGIIDQSDGKVVLKGGKRIEVTGELGVKYAVIPGRGPHQSRFRVTAEPISEQDIIEGQINSLILRRENVQRMERERNGLVKELCIVEDPSLRKLVIGDAIGSIVMALLNDKTSRKNINTLDNYLSRFERHKRRGDKNDNLRERFDVNRNYLEQMVALRERLQIINRTADDLDPGGAQIREEQMNEVTMRIANLQRELDDVGPA